MFVHTLEPKITWKGKRRRHGKVQAEILGRTDSSWEKVRAQCTLARRGREDGLQPPTAQKRSGARAKQGRGHPRKRGVERDQEQPARVAKGVLDTAPMQLSFNDCLFCTREQIYCRGTSICGKSAGTLFLYRQRNFNQETGTSGTLVPHRFPLRL